MAKIYEEVVVIKLSKLIKNTTDDVPTLVTADLITNLEVLVQELAGSDIVVEIQEV